MNSATYLSFFLLISSAGAAKSGGDDDWVHLPDKCEGNGGCYQHLVCTAGPAEEGRNVNVISLC